MPVVPIYLDIDEKTYAGIMSGALELCGLAKNIDSKRVAKHIPTVADAAKDGAAKAIDFVRGHQKGTLIVGGVIIAGGAIAGAINYNTYRKRHKLDKQFGEKLQAYIDAARTGELSLEILNELIDAMEMLEMEKPNQNIDLHISTAQLGELIHCIFDYTMRLAEANSYNTKTISRPKYFEKKTSDDLKYYLKVQKQIFEKCA